MHAVLDTIMPPAWPERLLFDQLCAITFAWIGVKHGLLGLR